MKKSNFCSFSLLSTFFFSLFLCSSSELKAWNEDYSPDSQPIERTVCVKNLTAIQKGSTIEVRSTQKEEPCLANEERYKLLIGEEPKGSLALIPILPKTKFYPLGTISWRSKDEQNSRLWHFTCLKSKPIELLGVQIKKFRYIGEIATSTEYQSCESAFEMAENICRNQFKGDEIFERCDSSPETLEF